MSMTHTTIGGLSTEDGNAANSESSIKSENPIRRTDYHKSISLQEREELCGTSRRPWVIVHLG